MRDEGVNSFIPRPLSFTPFAEVVEQVDTRDLKSLGSMEPCRFDSGPRYNLVSRCRSVEVS